MELKQGWMLLLWVAACVAFAGFLLLRNKKKYKPALHVKLIAHTSHYRDLTEYRQRLKLYKLLLTVTIVCFGLSLLLGVLLTARPASVSYITPETNNRDIMLCLDVSGSMREADIEALNFFKSVVKDFQGQRIGLTIFDSAAVTVFPLTKDYEAAADYLDETVAEFDEVTLQTYLESKQGASFIGEGITSCINGFGDTTKKRSRSIILATDNESGGGTITTSSAGALAKEKEVRIYALNPRSASIGAPDSFRARSSRELQQISTLTNGAYFELDDSNAVAGIIKEIDQQEATTLVGKPIKVSNDKPQVFLLLAAGLMFGGWIMRWRLL